MTNTKQSNNILPIVMMILLFGMISFVTNLASPMGDVLKNQFTVPNWMGTLGVLVNFIAYAVMGLPAGNLLQKYGYKKTAIMAIVVGIVGVGIQTLSGTLQSFGVYLAGAFVAGFSMCMLNTVVNPMLNTLAGGGNKGNQLIQIGGSFNSLCGTAVIILVGLLVGDITKAQISNVYPVMFIALAVFAAALLVIAFTKIPEPILEAKEEIKEAEETTETGVKVTPMSFPHFIMGAIAIFLYVGIEVGIPKVLNSWLIDPELNPLKLTLEEAAAVAGVVTATYWFLMLIGRLIGGAIGAKVSSKVMLSVASLVGLALVLGAIFADPSNTVTLPVLKQSLGTISFGTALVPINAALLVMVGLCTSIMWGAIFNLAVEGLGKHTAKASGLFMALVCGGGILPFLQNVVVDFTDYLTSYWVIVIALGYLVYYALVGSRPRGPIEKETKE